MPPVSVLEPSSGDLQVSGEDDGDSMSSGNSEKTAKLVGGMNDLSLNHGVKKEDHLFG